MKLQNEDGILGKLIILSFIINSIVKNLSVGKADSRLRRGDYFLGDITTTTPPAIITAMPISGDQLR